MCKYVSRTFVGLVGTPGAVTSSSHLIQSDIVIFLYNFLFYFFTFSFQQNIKLYPFNLVEVFVVKKRVLVIVTKSQGLDFILLTNTIFTRV